MSLKTAKMDATSHRWAAPLSNNNFSVTYKPGSNYVLSRIQWSQVLEVISETVKAVPVRVFKHFMTNLKSLATGYKH